MKNKKVITPEHWNHLMNKLLIDKGMDIDKAYDWLSDRFIVNEEK